ncbi:ephrin type A receptor 4 A [Trichuris trichiura]|uniref:receptor protein-tyrosine kinase n=1 Tax=Trichuris trichiura TaxID=36087 RepID=A0A077ZBU7_TRITR|nr:ephrin type A receptor 4 A [Trichuris trichiura]
MMTEVWCEESVPNVSEGNNLRAYTVCDFADENVKHWLVSSYIPRGSANRLFIQMTFTMRDCRHLPPTALTCKETFTLLYLETDGEVADAGELSINKSSFRLLDRITSNSAHNNGKEEMRRNSVVRSVAVNRQGIYFAFQDEGSCTSLLSVKVFYEVCEETLANFAWFEETPAGPELASIQETVGRCVENASYLSSTPPKYICKADGTWDLLSGGCQCNAGFEKKNDYCSPCEPNHFKDLFGPGHCEPCPKQSETRNWGSAFCQCEPGYFRALHDAYSTPCTRPPSKPENARVESVDQNSVVIVWNKPTNLGGRSELWYHIQCGDCPPSTQYSPAAERCLSTSVTITGLEPSTLYTVLIYAENDISVHVKSLQRAVVEVTTAPMIPIVLDSIRIESISEKEVTLGWDPPRSVGDYDPPVILHTSNSLDHDATNRRKLSVQYYVLKYFAKGRPSASHSALTTQEPHAFVHGLVANTEYGFKASSCFLSILHTCLQNLCLIIFPPVMSKGLPSAKSHFLSRIQVKAFTSQGWSEWSETKWLRTPSPRKMAGLDMLTPAENTTYATSASMTYLYTALGVLIVVISLSLVARWRRFPFSLCAYKKQPSDMDVLDYKFENFASDYNTIDAYGVRCELAACSSPAQCSMSVPYATSSVVTLPKQKYSAAFKPYVDPFGYEDPKQALKDFANEIERDRIVIDEVIGEGEFGEVCKGKLCITATHFEMVAIKMLKTGSSPKARLDFLAEASIMGQFDHPNVVQLKGIVTHTDPAMIVAEYLENGSLDCFVMKNRLETLQLVHMLCDVANGMKYLSDKGFIHRDLAARNILVDAKTVCKIADFGLSRVPTDSDEQAYTTKGGKIPVRWTAPEAIAYRKFTSASDVWSFGIVMWEVLSYGERPYWDWSNHDVISNVELGYRLPSPVNCPAVLYRLMRSCWKTERLRRPDFHMLYGALDSFLQCPASFQPESSFCPPTASAVDPIGNSTLHVCSMDEFCRSLKLERFVHIFSSHGVTSPVNLAELSAADVASMGISNDDQEYIMRALAYLKLAGFDKALDSSRKQHSLVQMNAKHPPVTGYSCSEGTQHASQNIHFTMPRHHSCFTRNGFFV